MSDAWAIGIYTGASPLELAPAHPRPVLTAADVDDIAAEFVADPFMIRTDAGFTMLFEILEAGTGLGRIGAAESTDGLRWRYRGVVLAEPFHLSYPFVFAWRGAIYMTPETLASGCVRLYRAERFPDRWRHVADLVDGPAADPSLLWHDGRAWLFFCPRPYRHDTLRLSFCESGDPRGPWIEHPMSSIVTADARLARPAGRPLIVDGRPVRLAQDCREVYGAAVTAIEIVELSPTTYAERPLAPPLLDRHGPAWGRAGMHHLDAHQLAPGRWIACVDGNAGTRDYENH